MKKLTKKKKIKREAWDVYEWQKISKDLKITIKIETRI